MRPLTRSCFFLLLLARFSLLVLPHRFGTCLPSLCSQPFSLRAPALIPSLSRQGAALTHLDSLPSHDLVLLTNVTVPSLFGKSGSVVLANCSLCGTEVTLSILAGLVCSSFLLKPAPICKLFAGLGSTNKSTTSLILATLSSFPFFFTSNSLAGTVFSLLLLYQATMGLRTVVSPRQRRG